MRNSFWRTRSTICPSTRPGEHEVDEREEHGHDSMGGLTCELVGHRRDQHEGGQAHRGAPDHDRLEGHRQRDPPPPSVHHDEDRQADVGGDAGPLAGRREGHVVHGLAGVHGRRARGPQRDRAPEHKHREPARPGDEARQRHPCDQHGEEQTECDDQRDPRRRGPSGPPGSRPATTQPTSISAQGTGARVRTTRIAPSRRPTTSGPLLVTAPALAPPSTNRHGVLREPAPNPGGFTLTACHVSL